MLLKEWVAYNMIFVFEDTAIREKFETELVGACICHSIDSEIFGDSVSSEDYMNRMATGYSIPFYKEIFRKQVALHAIENEYVILDCDPDIPDEVKRCPVIYITDRTEGNDEAYGQLPVKYSGIVENTVKSAIAVMNNWLEKYGIGRAEKDFYRDFLEVSQARVPQKLRLIACERVYGEYVAGVIVDFNDENIANIEKCIQTVRNAGYYVFVDANIDSHIFNINDNYYTILEAKDMDSFLDIANSLQDKNDSLIKDIKTLRDAIQNNIEMWKLDIYHNIYLKYDEEPNDYNKIPEGYIQIYYNNAYCEICLEDLGIEVGIDDVVFLSKVLDFIKEKLAGLGGNIRIGMYFYGGKKLQELLP